MAGRLARRAIARSAPGTGPGAAPPAAATARAGGKGILLLLGAAGAAALVIREYPAIRRELKMWRM